MPSPQKYQQIYLDKLKDVVRKTKYSVFRTVTTEMEKKLSIAWGLNPLQYSYFVISPSYTVFWSYLNVSEMLKKVSLAMEDKND